MAELPMSLVVKLASLVAHVQEGVDTGHPFDATAGSALAHDPEVTEWMATIDPVFLPAKR